MSTPVPTSPLARVGQIIYPARGALGVPLMVAVLLLGHPCPDASTTATLLRVFGGWTILLLGLFVRVWGVCCWFSRDRSGVIGGKRLMTTDGPYPYTRNPRYLGNFLMGFGASVLSGVPGVPMIYIVVWSIVHVPILVAERETLHARWGAEYERYCRDVPALLPRLNAGCSFVPQVLFVNWRGGLREEVGTVSGWLAIGLFLHFWRAGHLIGWRTGGTHFLFLVAIAIVVVVGEKVRRAIPREEVERAEDRPIRP